MMELLKEWITGITGVSIVLATAQCLMPEGTIRRVGKLAGGMLLLLALIMPLKSIDPETLSFALTEYRLAESDGLEVLKLENNRLTQKIIEEQTAAYILDKAKSIGAACSVNVNYEYTDEGIAYPIAVTIYGDLTEAQKCKLIQIIEGDLAVPKEKQRYVKGDGT